MATIKTEKYISAMLTENEKRSIGETVALINTILERLEEEGCRTIELLETGVTYTTDKLKNMKADLEYLGGKRPLVEQPLVAGGKITYPDR